MASLIPENIPSRNDVPERLKTAARLLRDATPDDVLVSLERTGGDEASTQKLDLGYEGSDPGNGSIPYLVVFDPASGVLVLETPPRLRSPSAAKRGRFRKQKQVGLDQAQSAIIDRVKGLQDKIKSLLIARALALPDVSCNQPLSLADEQTPRLYSEDFDEDSLLPAIRQILGGRRTTLDGSGQAQVRAAINPKIVIGRQGQMFDAAPQNDSEMIRVLDLAQERLAEHLGPGYRLIRGVAGSGKTLVLTHRARFIGQYFRQWRILLACFNRVLAQALAEELKDLANVEVDTVDSLASKVIRQAGRTPKPGNDGEAFQARRRQAAAAAASLPPAKRYDVVLVDEAQDLGQSGLDLCWAMGRHERATEQRHFLIALDSAQNVYRRKMNWNPPGVTARGRSTVLRKNYRNTKEILEFALGAVAGIGQPSAGEPSPDDLDALVMPEASLRPGGKPPDLLECSDLRTEAETLAKKTKELIRNEVAPDDIVILSGSKTLRIELQQTLRAKGIRALDAQKERDQVVSARGRVRVATLQLLKGLEYPHVLIGGANDIWASDDEDETRQRLIYVAMTRSVKTLTVTYSGDGSIGRLLQAAHRP